MTALVVAFMVVGFLLGAVALEDDLDGGPAEETRRFAFAGTDYEIDLSKKNADRLRGQLAPYLEHARRAGRQQPRRGGRTAASRQRSSHIRAWARQQGLSGRIPASVVQQYETAAKGRWPGRADWAGSGEISLRRVYRRYV